MDEVKEENGDMGKRKRVHENSRCREANSTDCTICLYDVPWIVSWVHLLAGGALFGAQSSCQATKRACPL